LYTVTTDHQSQQQVDALPVEALAPFAEARAILEIAPWNGAPYHKSKPDSPMRALTFGPAGQGDIVYLILDDLRRVDILVVVSAELTGQLSADRRGLSRARGERTVSQPIVRRASRASRPPTRNSATSRGPVNHGQQQGTMT